MRFLITVLFVFISFCAISQEAPQYKEKMYPNGKIMYKGMFQYGKPVGGFERFYPNGLLKASMNYKSDYVYVILFNDVGAKSAVGRYYKNTKDSVWEYFYKRKLLTKDSMSEGKKNGVCTLFYSDGTVKEECSWKNDVKDGLWTRYYRNGKKMFMTSYSNGLLHGSLETWNEGGNRELIGKYINAIKDGEWRYFGLGQKLRLTVNYKNGIPDKDLSEKQGDYLKEKEESEKKFVDPEKYMDYPDGYFNKIRNGRR